MTARDDRGSNAGGRPAGKAKARSVVYCLIPRELAPRLHDALRRHFRDDPGVEVIVERRAGERRAEQDRRAAGAGRRAERRRIRGVEGRRVGERRASLVPLVEGPELPRRARRYAERIAFVKRIEPTTQHAEDLDTARLVTHVQAGDREAFATLYLRYFDRVYSYLRTVLNDRDEAEDATQQVFTQILEAMPGYERRPSRPFRAWLFVVVRNLAIGQLEKLSRLDPMDPEELNRRREASDPAAGDLGELGGLGWISDRELTLFVERLPLPQRQVLLLRYMLDLTSTQIGAILGRNPDDVRLLQHRALTFLRERLTAVGRDPKGGERSRWRRRMRQAPVLRSRRYALSP